MLSKFEFFLDFLAGFFPEAGIKSLVLSLLKFFTGID